MPMKRVVLFLADEQIRKARKLGKEMDRSMASVVRRALEHYFKEDEFQLTEPGTKLMKRVALFLADKQIRKARSLGILMGRPMAWVVRGALEHYFKTDAIQKELRRSEPRRQRGWS